MPKPYGYPTFEPWRFCAWQGGVLIELINVVVLFQDDADDFYWIYTAILDRSEVVV